jgi:hypothetical protein
MKPYYVVIYQNYTNLQITLFYYVIFSLQFQTFDVVKHYEIVMKL